ncbi:HAD family hydrolase [Methylosinus sp. R-45379]|uniref:HAD family hydrolase n=1 Tax=Methylosinus sp. R-45379 TaxID=980563 RepID=UPI0007C98891|nr:HAD family hydrolase [Methylosinus sp. R-45379]
MPVSAVLFDLDETLFNRSASLRDFVADQFSTKWHCDHIDFNAVVDRFLELDARGRLHKMEVYGTLLAELGLADSDVAKEMFFDYETRAWRFARAFDGAAELLSWLTREGVRFGIVSNGQTHIQLRSILALNLDRLTDVYLISEQEKCRKPDPEIFRRAADRLGISTGQCVFVGDSPEADMFGARSVGMKTVWFPNGAAWPTSYLWQPDATVSSLFEAREVIANWITN